MRKRKSSRGYYKCENSFGLMLTVSFEKSIVWLMEAGVALCQRSL